MASSNMEEIPPQSLPFQESVEIPEDFFFLSLHSMAYNFMWPRGKRINELIFIVKEHSLMHVQLLELHFDLHYNLFFSKI